MPFLVLHTPLKSCKTALGTKPYKNTGVDGMVRIHPMLQYPERGTLMIEQEPMSRAEMVRSPMAVLPVSSPPLSPDSGDPVKRLLQPYAELLKLPVPEPQRALVECSDPTVPQASRDL